ncbi:MAG TPA: hypothetical protein ENJ28_07540 [Gammaproteobacteria bacterium]|nr:hypothetical protein [Gammaproteobacteria bacterium]
MFFFSGCFAGLSIGTFLDANFPLHAVSTGTACLGRNPLEKTFQAFSFSKPRRLLLDFSFLQTVKLDFISFFALPFLELGFVDTVKQNNHFSQSQVGGRIVRLIGFFLFTPNASHQRAAKSGGAFASAKDTTLLAVRLDEFVGRSLLHD